MDTPSFLEDDISKLPALDLLIKMGWEYLPPKEALALRNNKKSAVLLEPIIDEQLRATGHYSYRGELSPFPDSAIRNTKDALRDYIYDGLVRTN